MHKSIHTGDSAFNSGALGTPDNVIPFVNPARSNLCYINATFNALIKCSSFRNVLQSSTDSELVNKLKQLTANNFFPKSNTDFREWLITKGYSDFDNNTQNDPDELLRAIFDLSDHLMDLFKSYMLASFTCEACHHISNDAVDSPPLHGFQEAIPDNDSSVDVIFTNNRKSIVEKLCNTCDRNNDHVKRELFSSLPKILMIQALRFRTTGFGVNFQQNKLNSNIQPSNTKQYR